MSWLFVFWNQGTPGYSWEDRYPFIKQASAFSSSSSSFSANGADRTFDYIIVGGGTAGCPLASTLSQKFSVLLLERGGVPFTNVNVSFLQNFHLTLADISDTSASQFFSSTDGVLNSRARILGGGTSINAGFYTRASRRYLTFFSSSFKTFAVIFRLATYWYIYRESFRLVLFRGEISFPFNIWCNAIASDIILVLCNVKGVGSSSFSLDGRGLILSIRWYA